jgi:hypothetical protein
MCIENSRSLTNELFDPETGQALFHPRTGRAPKGRQRSKNPGEKLYADAIRSRERREWQKKEDMVRTDQGAARTYARKHTNRLVENAKAQNFSAIF